MKVKAYCINKGQSSQHFVLITDEGQELQYAPNNWKTEAGALRWARNHGYKIATEKIGKKKNVSATIPNGRVIRTRDSYVGESHGYDKPKKKGLYRMAVIVDSNTREEIAIVKLTTSEKGTPLPDYKDGKSRYRNFIQTVDCNGDPIVITPASKEYRKSGKPRFEEASESRDLSKKDVNKIKRDCITDPKTGRENRSRLHKMKDRK